MDKDDYYSIIVEISSKRKLSVVNWGFGIISKGLNLYADQIGGSPKIFYICKIYLWRLLRSYVNLFPCCEQNCIFFLLYGISDFLMQKFDVCCSLWLKLEGDLYKTKQRQNVVKIIKIKRYHLLIQVKLSKWTEFSR